MAVVGGIVFIIIGLFCGAALALGSTGFWLWLFALGGEIFALFAIGCGFAEDGSDSDATYPKVLAVVGTAFWGIALWLGFSDAEGTASALICMAGLFIAPYLIVVSLDAFFGDSVSAMVFIGIAKLLSSVLLYVGTLTSLDNIQNEFPWKTITSFIIVSLLMLLFWIMVVSKKIASVPEEKRKRRMHEEEQRKISCSRQLVFAASNNDKNAVLNMLEQGADVNYRDSDGKTPLSNAVRNENIDIVEILLEKGADDYCEDKPLLFLCIEKNYKKFVELLVKKGAYKESQYAYADFEEVTPLFYAVWMENKDAVLLLLESKVDVDAGAKKYGLGISPLCYAVIMNNKEIASILVDNGANINYDDGHTTPLEYAINNNNKDMASFLIEKGANINYGDEPLLFSAIRNKNKEMVSFLLEKGADMYCTSEIYVDRETLYGPNSMVDILGKKKKVTATPLLEALKEENYDPEIVSLLIENGVDVNLELWEGYTPLKFAVLQNNKEIVSLLLKKGAKPNELGLLSSVVKSDSVNNKTVYYLNKDMATLLINSGANPSDLLFFVDVEIAQFALDKGADVNYEKFYKTYRNSSVPLSWAICTIRPDSFIWAEYAQLQKEMALLLISHGADVNHEISRPSEKNAARTPLETAIETGNAEMVSLLITYGADVNYKTKNGNTPLLFAALHGKSEIVPLLKEAGAVSNAVGKSAQTTAAVATNRASSDVQDDSAAFNAALVALSKIIAKNGAEIFAPQNSQKLKALVSDLLPQENEIAAKLKQALSCDFAQIMVDATDKSDDKKEKSFGEAVDKSIVETGLEKEAAVSMVKLVALALDWDLESVTVQ